MTSNSYEIDYKKWNKIVINAQLIMTCCIFAIEVVDNILLYVTRSQGYGPDTIVQKLLRYLVLTSSINYLFLILSFIVSRVDQNERRKRYLLLLFTTLICANAAFSHYQFATTLAVFVIPLVISLVYEERKLTIFTFIVSLLGVAAALIARAMDPLYNHDIAPEVVITLALIGTIFAFALIINRTMLNRREEMQEAFIQTEKAKVAADKMTFSFKMLETLTSTIDAKDKYTNGHSMRVASYATQLAEALGWNEADISKLRYEALLHDIGKIGVPDLILNKPSKLSDVEFGLIKAHTVIGSDILKNMVVVPNATEVARHHHERYDGKGYPSGLAATEIPLNARIVCIADSYDAMSSDRIYRKALPRDVIREELVKGRGTQFDPDLLDVFMELFDQNLLEVSTDSLTFTENDSSKEQQHIAEDIEKVIGKLASMSEQQNSLRDFSNFFQYMKSIGQRYNRSIEVLSVDILPGADVSSMGCEEELSDLLQVAIRKNIRAVDVYYRYSTRKHMIILLDAGVENIKVIQQRIQFDYETAQLSEGSTLQFTLNESIEAPDKKA